MEYKIIEHKYGNSQKVYYIYVRRWKWLPIWSTVNMVLDYERSLIPITFTSIREAEDYAIAYIYGLLSNERTVKRGSV